MDGLHDGGRRSQTLTYIVVPSMERRSMRGSGPTVCKGLVWPGLIVHHDDQCERLAGSIGRAALDRADSPDRGPNDHQTVREGAVSRLRTASAHSVWCDFMAIVPSER
jgi:hypothetical protein